MTDSNARQKDWEGRYLAGKTGWDRGETSPAFHFWFDKGEFPPGRILVPGCGHGHEILELAKAGFQVTAVDIAPPPVMTLMKKLTEAGLHAKVIQADLLHWQPAEPFDAVYEQTCICALDPSHWQEYEARLANWLLPGGKLFALFMQTGKAGGPPFHCPVPDMRAIFAESRWQWPDEEPIKIAHREPLFELGYVLVRR